MKALKTCVFLTLSLGIPTVGAAQGLPGGGGGQGGRIEGSHKIIPLPYFNYNRSIGASFGALPMVMRRPVSRASALPPFGPLT